MKLSTPNHWIKGQLLDLKRFGDGNYRTFLLGEGDTDPPGPFIAFDSTFAAQQFISEWYAREVGPPG